MHPVATARGMENRVSCRSRPALCGSSGPGAWRPMKRRAVRDRIEGSLANGDDTRRRLLDAVLQEALAPNAEKTQQDIPTIAQNPSAPLKVGQTTLHSC